MSADDQIEELKRIIEEERQQKLAKKQAKRKAWLENTPKEYRKEKYSKVYQRIKNSDKYKDVLAKQKERKRLWRQDADYRKKQADQAVVWNKRKKEEQAGRPKPHTCEVCEEPGRIMFDHSHTTGKFRGWLCHNCNFVLGHVRDNPNLLEKLAVYLRTHDA